MTEEAKRAHVDKSYTTNMKSHQLESVVLDLDSLLWLVVKMYLALSAFFVYLVLSHTFGMPPPQHPTCYYAILIVTTQC